MSDPFTNPDANPFDSGWQQPPPAGDGGRSGPAQDGGAWSTGTDQGWGQDPAAPGWGQAPGDQGWSQDPAAAGWGQSPPPAPGWQQPAPFGQQPYGQQGPGAPPAFGQPGQWAPQPHTQGSGSGNRVVVIVLAVVAVVILGVVGAAVALFSAADSVLDTTFAEGGGIPEGTRLLDTGGSVSATGGTARFEFTVADRTAVQIDVIGRNGFDPVTTLYGPGGVVIQEDDDGGSGFDSRIARELTAGTYVVEIEGFAGDTGDFDIIVTDR